MWTNLILPFGSNFLLPQCEIVRAVFAAAFDLPSPLKEFDVFTHSAVKVPLSLFLQMESPAPLETERHVMAKRKTIDWTDSLLTTVLYKDEEDVRFLLQQQDRDLEAVDEQGRTVLQLACKLRYHRIAEILLDHGASVHTAHATTGETALHLAVRAESEDTVALLLRRGANVSAVDRTGSPAPHDAAAGDGDSKVEPKRCATALHVAVEQRSLPMVELLLHYEADVNAEDEEGKTPLEQALNLRVQHKLMLACFVTHLGKMKAQSLYISENNLKELSENIQIKGFSAGCDDEIVRMRNSAIGDSSVKMYDILTKGDNRLADYVSNEMVDRILDSEKYVAEFPIYKVLICKKFLQGRERRDLLRQSSDWLWTVINEIYGLPYILVERINRCLTNEDLALQIG